MHDELDIIREVGSIAASHASIALAEILGRKINLAMPLLEVVACSGISTKIDMGQMGIAIICRITTGIKGEAVFILDEKNAFKLIGLSSRTKEGEKRPVVLTEVGLSTLKEIGNIVISAYLNAIAMLLKKIVLSLPPTFISGTTDEILNIIFSSAGANDFVLVIRAVFEEPGEAINGGFYLVLSQGAASDIREACKKLLEEIKNS